MATRAAETQQQKPTRKLLLVEFNEINWGVIDALIAQRGEAFLPNFSRLKREGTWGAPTALEQPPLLDPWITWVTLHTGVPQSVHGARVLEQDRGVGDGVSKRSWEYVAEAGLSVGIFGSIGSYPPRPVNGFMVPGPFAPSNATYPAALEPIQALNRGQTQAHAGNRKPQSVVEMATAAAGLMKRGLRVSTCARVLMQLAAEVRNAGSRWRRVTLQPLVNFDFFAALYRKHRPAYATWHSNHAAHFMHHYWRAWDGSAFTSASSESERKTYGEAVPFGYRVCDDLLGRFIDLIDDDTVLLVCSSMGQKPYRSDAYQQGKVIVRFRNIEAFLAALGVSGVTETVATMVPQFNLRIPDPRSRAAAIEKLGAVTRSVGGRTEKAIALEVTGETITVTPLGLPQLLDNVTYQFPGSAEKLPFDRFFVADAPTVKQGMHDPAGLLIAYGAGVPRGIKLGDCTNLDIAPTILDVLGVPVPPEMTGRALL